MRIAVHLDVYNFPLPNGVGAYCFTLDSFVVGVDTMLSCLHDIS